MCQSTGAARLRHIVWLTFRLRVNLLRAKIQASQEHFQKGKRFHEAGVLERAMMEFRQAVELDPTNQYAESELRKVLVALRAARENGPRPSSIAEMKEKMRGIRAQPPVLNPRSKEPIDLTFHGWRRFWQKWRRSLKKTATART